MSLHYLSGDSLGATKAQKKAKKKEKKAAKKDKPKKVKKILVAPARAAMLTVITLNLLKTGTKMARIWNKPGGKDALNGWWKKFGGDPNKLKEAISKGSKQKISGVAMGVATATVIATATPLIIALVPLIKHFKAEGDAKESAEFDKELAEGKDELASNSEFPSSIVKMPEEAEIAQIKPRPGAPGEKETPLAMHTNPLSICFILVLIAMWIQTEFPSMIFASQLIAIYAVIGFVVIPFSEFGFAGTRVQRIARKYFDVPAACFFKIINLFADGKKKIFG